MNAFNIADWVKVVATDHIGQVDAIQEDFELGTVYAISGGDGERFSGEELVACTTEELRNWFKLPVAAPAPSTEFFVQEFEESVYAARYWCRYWWQRVQRTFYDIEWHTELVLEVHKWLNECPVPLDVEKIGTIPLPTDLDKFKEFETWVYSQPWEIPARCKKDKEK